MCRPIWPIKRRTAAHNRLMMVKDPAAPLPAAQDEVRCERSERLRVHQPLVKAIAQRLRGRLPANVQLDELVQAGMLGLNEALSRFEASLGIAFDTYASRRIEG